MLFRLYPADFQQTLIDQVKALHLLVMAYAYKIHKLLGIIPKYPKNINLKVMYTLVYIMANSHEE